MHKATLARRVDDAAPPSIHVHYDLRSTFDVEEKLQEAPGSEDVVNRLNVQDDVEPDSLSEASKSDDGSIVEQKRPQPETTPTSFYIGSEEAVPKPEACGPTSEALKLGKPHKSFSTATLTKPRGHQNSGKVRPNVSAPLLREGSPESRDVSAVQLIRQESFTKERPSSTRLPNITSLPVQRDSLMGSCSQDTQSYLKDTEVVLAALEAKLQAGRPGASPVADSLSGESDVDTSSSVSQQSGKTKPDTAAGKKYPVVGLHKKKSLVAADRGRTAAERVAGLRRGVGKRGSTDLSDDPQGFPSSDQESSGTRKYTVPLQKEDGRSSRASQALTRTNSLSAPRPTRASMLRRARLGEASDNEGAETDRAPAPPPQEAKKLSRLDMLAMPRKRTSSFNTTSDTEASSSSAAQHWAGRSAGFSNRSTEIGGYSTRRASASGPKPVERPQKATLGKTPVTRARSGSAKYANSTASE